MLDLVIPPRSKKEERIQVNFHIQAEVLGAEVARRKANVWLLMNAGNLLGAENPELILRGDKLLWRVDIVLTSPKRGIVGCIGKLYLDAVTGEALPTDNLADELIANADTLTSH